jgi:hypothetical protein
LDIDTCHVVGVSFISLVESLPYEELEERLESTYGAGFGYALDQRGLDQTTDAFVGVVFQDRPSDEEVAEATRKVTDGLSQIQEIMKAAPDSDVTCWTATSFS